MREKSWSCGRGKRLRGKGKKDSWVSNGRTLLRFASPLCRFSCFIASFLPFCSFPLFFPLFFYFLSFFVIQRKQERSWSIFLTDSQRSRWCVRPIMRQTDPPLSVPSAQLKASSSGSRANDGAMGRKAISNDPDEDVSNVV